MEQWNYLILQDELSPQLSLGAGLVSAGLLVCRHRQLLTDPGLGLGDVGVIFLGVDRGFETAPPLAGVVPQREENGGEAVEGCLDLCRGEVLLANHVDALRFDIGHCLKEKLEKERDGGTFCLLSSSCSSA